VATCPRCKGPLTETHQCPRRPVAEALWAIGISIAGGLSVFVIFSLIDTQQRYAHLDPWVFLIGCLAARGIQIYLRSR
jgi:hypothetical protein